MTGYWPSSFLSFTDRDEGQYPAILTEQVWTVKDLEYGRKITPKNFAFAVNKTGNRRSILTARVANHNTRFASSCPLAEPAINRAYIKAESISNRDNQRIIYMFSHYSFSKNLHDLMTEKK